MALRETNIKAIIPNHTYLTMIAIENLVYPEEMQEACFEDIRN